MSIVYDRAPEIAYDPAARVERIAVDYARPHRFTTTAPAGFGSGIAPTAAPPATQGFGNVTARRMLSSGPPAKHPWLTVELAEQELAIQAYGQDRVAVAMDSVHEAQDVSL